MASTQGKGKGKKTKGVKMSLQDLLAQDSAAPQGFNVVSTRKLDWAAAMENEEIDDTFTLNFKRDNTKVLLPTAPKSTRGPDVDMSKVPTQPPFKAYLGNLPYDVTEGEISRFFNKLNLKDVRLPRENGRPRGFGYAEFNDRQSLIEALSINGDTFKNRLIRVGLPGDNENTRDPNREEKQDRTAGDWRAASREDPNSTREPPRDAYPRNGAYDNSYADKAMQRNRTNFESGASDNSYNSRNRFENDRVFQSDRQSERILERSSDRSDRTDRSDRGFERTSDRVFDRQSDRGFDRQSDRGFDRQSDRGFDKSNEFGYDKQNDRYDRPNNRFAKNNRYDRSYGNFDRTDGQDYQNERDGPNRGGQRNDSQSSYDRSYGKRFEERRYQDSDQKFQSDRRGDRNFSDRRREYGGNEKRKEDSSYTLSSSPHQDIVENIPKERPKLNLKPRSKPLEETNETVVANSAIFGGAKPVNTAAREKIIEEKLLKEKEENERKNKDLSSNLSSTERIRRVSASSNVSANSRSRKGSESGPLSQREDYDENYKSSSSSAPRNRRKFERTTSGSESVTSVASVGQKQILRRNKDRDPPTSTQTSRNPSANQKPRGFKGPIGGPVHNFRRKDRERDNTDTYYRPNHTKSLDEADNKIAYTSENKFAHLNDDMGDYDDNDDVGRASE